MDDARPLRPTPAAARPPRHSAARLREAHSRGGPSSIAVALAANIVVAAAKLAAGLVSGSSAMLAEALHSSADSINEVMLGVSLRSRAGPQTPAIRSATVAPASCGRSWPRSRRS
jgi:Cation efflux family